MFLQFDHVTLNDRHKTTSNILNTIRTTINMVATQTIETKSNIPHRKRMHWIIQYKMFCVWYELKKWRTARLIDHTETPTEK